VTLREIAEGRGAAGRANEAAAIAAAKPKACALVALDERGTTWASEDLAHRLVHWRDAGTPGVVFAIGGADGLDPALRASAELVLAFGAVTWPHLLVRAMLAEQIYRALTIIGRHPYHRD
jgi:23S rRNA (pseudouridine1915-N3)-methyltransferase